jgi:hypothetical protein
MFEIEETVAIEQPIDMVWAFLMDETNEPLWQTTLTDVRRLTAGPLAAGSRVLETRRFLGRGIETEWEMVECAAPRRSSIRSLKAPFSWGGTYELEPVGSGTRFTAQLKGEPGGFFRVAEPVFARMARRELATNLANLKDVLEAGVGIAVGRPLDRVASA